MFGIKKLAKKIDDLRQDCNVSDSLIRTHALALDELSKLKLTNFAECFNCGVLANKNKMKPLAVFESDVFEATKDREFYLICNGNSGDDKTTTIYFCNRCKAQLPKKN